MSATMLRAAPRALTRPSLRPRSALRPSQLAVACAAPRSPARFEQQRFATAPHAISGPTLAGIEKRWEFMPPQEQAELWMGLRDRMVEDWHHLTLQEKKASYYIAFGPHGPRKESPPGENWQMFWYTMGLSGLGVVLFFVIRIFARPAPRTMTKEWQEKTEEYLKKQKADPIDGISSDGYNGPSFVRSKAAKSD